MSKELQDCAKIFINILVSEDRISGDKGFAAGQRPAFQEALRSGASWDGSALAGETEFLQARSLCVAFTVRAVGPECDLFQIR